MNILVMVHDMIVPNKGGGAPRTDAVAKAFKRNGHNVYVFAPVGVPLKKAEEELGCNVIRMRNIDRHDRRKTLKHGLYNPLLTLETLWIVRNKSIDMIFVHDSICGFPAVIASKIFKIPVVLDITDFIAEYVGKAGLKRFLRRIAKHLEDIVIRNSTKIITVSNAMKKILEEKGAGNISVVYDGVDFDVFHKYGNKYRKEQRFAFIYQGGMDPQDGLDILIPAAQKVADKIPNVEFWLVGGGAAVPSLKAAVKRYNVDKCFWFTGWVPYKEVAQYISDADVGLVILPNTPSAQVRVTLKTFEYWACGKPIIAAELDALKEIINDDAGLFYKPGNPEDLAEKMIKLCSDRELYVRLSENGLKKVKDFEWKKLGEKIVDIALSA